MIFFSKLHSPKNTAMKKQTLVLALALLANAFPLFAQKAPFRFGDVSIEELTMASCSFYPEASAMILGEMGEIYFRYDDEKGWQYTLEVTRRSSGWPKKRANSAMKGLSYEISCRRPRR